MVLRLIWAARLEKGLYEWTLFLKWDDMKLHIQVGPMMIWCNHSAALVPECTGKPSSLRWQSRRPPGMELCCGRFSHTKQERMSLRNNIKRAAQTSWKFAYSLSIKIDEGYWCLSWWLIWASCFFDRCLSKVSASVVFFRKTVSLDIDICISTYSKLQFCLSEGWTCWALCRWASRSSHWLSHGVWCPGTPLGLPWDSWTCPNQAGLRRGFSKFSASAEKTEQAAHEGRIRPTGGPQGISWDFRGPDLIETCQGLGQSRFFVHWLLR